MEARDGVEKSLYELKGVSVQKEWLDACVQWILEEEGAGLPAERLLGMVYNQWLHADLRDVSRLASIPTEALEQEKGFINGRFIVQVNSIVDVGSAAYAQLHKLKGQSLDTGEGTHDQKKNYDPKPTRLLLLSLTDGITDIQAMEYRPIQELNCDLIPGTKISLEGEIVYRLGVLLLRPDCVRVLGGGVDHLAVENKAEKVLSGILNISDPTVGSENSNQPQEQVPILSESHGETQLTATVSSPQYVTSKLPTLPETAHNFGGSVSSGPNSGEPSSTGQCDMAEFGFDEGLDDFDNFDVAEDDLMRVELFDEGELIDQPGHEEWADEIDDFERKIIENQDIIFQASEDHSNAQCAVDSTSTTTSHSSAPKSKLSLRGKSVRTRVVETDAHPPVATVHPIQRQECLELNERLSLVTGYDTKHTISLGSLSKLLNHEWSVHPLVKVKAHFSQVCNRISHSGGKWLATVILEDDVGGSLKTHLSNEILAIMIGFTADEFNNHIKPNREDPILKLKASNGFARCQSAICDLNCYMVLAQITAGQYPYVVRLLDM